MIDVVYTWVDGAAPGFAELVRAHAEEPGDLNPERYRDLHDTLRYSLRSLEAYARWVRRVYLLTCRPQVPSWLDASHPRLRVVHHDEIIDPDFLPTFNTRVIESYLHRLPDAAPHVLHMNDDFLFGRETSSADFLDPDGRVRLFGTLFGEHPSFRIFADRWVIKPLPAIEHAPVLIHRDSWADMLEWHPHETLRTRRNRFRRTTDLKMRRLYNVFMLTHRKPLARAVPAWHLLRYHRFHMITNDYPHQSKSLDRLWQMRPKFYCLNDDQGPTPDPRVVDGVRALLDQWYPKPSSFELR